ncbi:CTLH/CRA C-terminal to lish motif domain-containing protein [Neocallimastix lanati (nom. inval.)]|nr:CTLH/CRA C-terminal to lish motif domain-containing protein [Neocallimastix sp. JGI-2020a]
MLNKKNPAKKVITKEKWESKLSNVSVEKTDLNKLIMNYLVIEGYKDAAEKFSQESGLQPTVDLLYIEERMDIRNTIQSGNIDEAIEKVNDLDPEILDNNPKLYFHLQQQKLIEFIKQGKIMEAIEFAQEELAPRGEENTDKSPVKSLLEHSQRQKTASELNSAILTSQCQDRDPRLLSLLKLLSWAQDQLNEKAIYPNIKNFVTAKLESNK